MNLISIKVKSISLLCCFLFFSSFSYSHPGKIRPSQSHFSQLFYLIRKNLQGKNIIDIVGLDMYGTDNGLAERLLTGPVHGDKLDQSLMSRYTGAGSTPLLGLAHLIPSIYTVGNTRGMEVSQFIYGHGTEVDNITSHPMGSVSVFSMMLQALLHIFPNLCPNSYEHHSSARCLPSPSDLTRGLFNLNCEGSTATCTGVTDAFDVTTPYTIRVNIPGFDEELIHDAILSAGPIQYGPFAGMYYIGVNLDPHYINTAQYIEGYHGASSQNHDQQLAITNQSPNHDQELPIANLPPNSAMAVVNNNGEAIDLAALYYRPGEGSVYSLLSSVFLSRFLLGGGRKAGQ